MSITVTILVEFFALIGHAILWIVCANRIHGSTKLSPKVADSGVNCVLAVFFFFPGWAAWSFFNEGIIPFGAARLDTLTPVAQSYIWFCAIFCLVSTVIWTFRKIRQRPPRQLLAVRVSQFDLRKIGQPVPEDASWMSRSLVRMPLNEVLRPKLVEYEIMLAQLPRELDGFVITHFTDLHVNGCIGWGYFEEIVRLSNQQQPDMVVLTGDLLNRTAMAERLAETLARLEASVGRYFILGNHDHVVDYKHLRNCFSQAGLIDLGRYCEALTFRDQKIHIIGNEVPWFVSSNDLDACYAAAENALAEGERPFRIVLAHSPDQIDWAIEKNFDLMIAGHLHGGQICLPWIGPIRSPSRYGGKYAGGVYDCESTLLCVSRGISAQLPFRWNCPPELVKLVLRSEK